MRKKSIMLLQIDNSNVVDLQRIISHSFLKILHEFATGLKYDGGKMPISSQ